MEKRMMAKKWLTGMVTSLLLACLLAGCAVGTDGTAGETADTAVAAIAMTEATAEPSGGNAQEDTGETATPAPEAVQAGAEEPDGVMTADTAGAEEDKGDDAMEETDMKLYFNDTEIPVIWEENKSVAALREEAANGDIVVEMSMYGGWEQVGRLGRSYPRNDTEITAENGDIVLYSGNQIVVFYGSNSWAYTRLGRMQLGSDEVTNLLGGGDITLTITRS